MKDDEVHNDLAEAASDSPTLKGCFVVALAPLVAFCLFALGIWLAS